MAKDGFDPPHTNVQRHIMSGMVGTGSSQITGALCQFASVVILSRLLEPGDFGVAGMVWPVLALVYLFQDFGLSDATVQRERVSNEEINAFFWLNMALGTCFMVLVIALSPLVGWFYGDSRTVALTGAMSTLAMLTALGSQHTAILKRRMAFGYIAAASIAGAFGGLVVSTICAYLFRNYWALFWGSLAGTTIPVILSWIFSGWRPSRPRYVAGVREMLGFGAGITGANFMSYLARNADNVLIGRVWGDVSLGLYDRAYKLLLFPIQRLIIPLGGTMIPLLSRLVDEREKYRATFFAVFEACILLFWPGILWTSVFSDVLIAAVLGEKWSGAAGIFRVLSFSAMAQVAYIPVAWLFVSQGRSGDFLRWGFGNAALCIGGFLIGLPYGAFGVAAGYAITEVVRMPYAWWCCGREGPVTTRSVISSVVPVAAASTGAYIVLWILSHTLLVGYPIVTLGCGLVASYALTCLFLFCLPSGRKILKRALAPLLTKGAIGLERA